ALAGLRVWPWMEWPVPAMAAPKWSPLYPYQSVRDRIRSGSSHTSRQPPVAPALEVIRKNTPRAPPVFWSSDSELPFLEKIPIARRRSVDASAPEANTSSRLLAVTWWVSTRPLNVDLVGGLTRLQLSHP